MPVPASEIERLIRDAFPGASIDIRDLAGELLQSLMQPQCAS